MKVIVPVEILYLTLMQKWLNANPPEQYSGLLDGDPERSAQSARLVYIIQKIASGNPQSVYSTLALYSRRKDGESYISQDPSWMEQSFSLGDGWFFEENTSLLQKQSITRCLSKLGLSNAFCRAVEDFIAGHSLESYFPTEPDKQKSSLAAPDKS